jgi:hypothetical protein
MAMVKSPAPAQNNYKIAALVLLSLVALSTIFNGLSWWQTKWQLTSPVIPRSTVNAIALPYLYTSLATIPFVVAALLCYRFRSYLACAIISSIALAGQYIYIVYRPDL